jgi:enoyl-[acyl-carrier protein] reductase I
MVNRKEFNNEWALILGGSSGLGLATAKKLADHGMNICIVHRNLRNEMEGIQSEFSSIREKGVSMVSFNKDACREDHVMQVIDDFRTWKGWSRESLDSQHCTRESETDLGRSQ